MEAEHHRQARHKAQCPDRREFGPWPVWRPPIPTKPRPKAPARPPVRPRAKRSEAINSDGLPLLGDPWLDEAIRHGNLGRRVIPLQRYGISPLVDLDEATTDTDQIRRWWMSHPWCNWGVVTEEGEWQVGLPDRRRRGR